jgi:hypothetical protein
MIEKPLMLALSGRLGPRWMAQPVGGAQHVAVGFFSKLQEQIGFGTVRLGERELPVADGPGLVFLCHGSTQRNISTLGLSTDGPDWFPIAPG